MRPYLAQLASSAASPLAASAPATTAGANSAALRRSLGAQRFEQVKLRFAAQHFFCGPANLAWASDCAYVVAFSVRVTAGLWGPMVPLSADARWIHEQRHSCRYSMCACFVDALLF